MPLEHLLERQHELLSLPEIRATTIILEMLLASYACKYVWLNTSGIRAGLDELKTITEKNFSPEDYSKIIHYDKWVSALPFPIDAAYFYAWVQPKMIRIVRDAQENQNTNYSPNPHC
ncbi:MAG: hypothetical protein AABW48_02715 [Nanoarchaeota archaeon]